MLKHSKKIPILCTLLFFATMASAQNKDTLAPRYGKYGCTASSYRGGSVTYSPKGFFVIEQNGKYTYNGFEKPSAGRFNVDKKGNLLFSGGYFDKGIAEKIDRPNKFFLTFPTNPDNRWTCSLLDK